MEIQPFKITVHVKDLFFLSALLYVLPQCFVTARNVSFALVPAAQRLREDFQCCHFLCHKSLARILFLVTVSRIGWRKRIRLEQVEDARSRHAIELRIRRRSITLRNLWVLTNGGWLVHTINDSSPLFLSKSLLFVPSGVSAISNKRCDVFFSFFSWSKCEIRLRGKYPWRVSGYLQRNTLICQSESCPWKCCYCSGFPSVTRFLYLSFDQNIHFVCESNIFPIEEIRMKRYVEYSFWNLVLRISAHKSLLLI